MDEIKLLANNEKQLETLLQTKRTYCNDIRMEFGIEKQVMLKMKSRGKKKNRRNRTAKSRKNQNAGDQENYKPFGITEMNTITQAEMKEKNQKKEKTS